MDKRKIKRTLFSIVDTKYFVNEEKRVVVCRLRFRLNDKCEDLVHSQGYYWYLRHKGKCIFSGIVDGDQFDIISTSKCHIDDTWNEVEGKRIAESKAKQQLYKLAKSFFETIKKAKQEDIENLDSLIETCNIARNRETAHFNELVDKQ